MFKKAMFLLGLCAVSGCSDNGVLFRSFTKYETGDTTSSYIVGYPYQIDGQTYEPKEDYTYKEKGVAGWYDVDSDYSVSTNGEKYDKNVLTAMHKTLPLPSMVKIINLKNGKAAIVRVNERGPYDNNRLMDVSKETATVLGFDEVGTTPIQVEVLAKNSKIVKARLLGVKEEFTEETKVIVNQEKTQSEPVLLTPAVKEEVQSIDSVIQIGAFEKQKHIDLIKENLSNMYQVITTPVDVNQKTLYRVQVGGFENEQELTKALENIHEIGYTDAMIVR